MFAALALLAAAGLLAVAWSVQSNGVEPIEVDRDTPSESVSSEPAPASIDAGDPIERDGDGFNRSDPDPSPVDPGDSGPVAGEQGSSREETGTAAEDSVTGSDGSDTAAAESGTGSDGSDTAAAESGTGSGESDIAAVETGQSAAPASPSGEAGAVTAPEDEPATGNAEGAVVDVPDPDDGPVAPLTGELTSDVTLAERRALAVKVGNSDRRSRPQAGLSAADVVYEALIEGGKSRFMAVFHSEVPDRIGPVRSVRSGDIDLLADLSTPYLASSGANTTVLAEMRRAVRAGTFIDVGGLRTFVPYSRDPSRLSPYNLYFYFENLVAGDAALPGGPLAAPVPSLFDYGSPNPAGIADAIGVTVTFHRSAGNVVSHIWDAAVGGWVRIQGGALMTTETDFGLTEVAPVNVAVMWMPHHRSAGSAESPEAQSYGTGDALVLTAGTVHNAVWERTEDRAGFRFSDADGNPLSLSPGSTWLLIANSSRRYPVTQAEVLTAADGARLLADARAAARAAAGAA